MTDGGLGRKVVSGVLLVGVRGLLLRLVAFGGNIALARLLAPSAFGTVAFALAFIGVGRFLGDAGLGAALIRSPAEPEVKDLAACAGIQLLATVGVVAACLLALPFGGQVAQLTALISLSLPFAALRSPSVIRLERRLAYRPIVAAETAEVLASYLVAVTVAAAGGGAYGIALGAVVGAGVGTVLLPRLAPGTWVPPLLDLGRARRLLPFGLAYQGIALLNVLRDEGVNVGIYVILGASPLGIWTLAYRILQVPFLLFEGLWRVSFPAMVRLVAEHADVRPVLERGVAVAGAWTGLVLSALVGGAPALVPAVFGARWTSVVAVLPAAALSLLVGGPLSAAGAGYLYAIGDTARVTRGAVIHTACWLLVGLPLLPLLGVPGISVGWLAGGLAETALFAAGLRRHAGTRLLRPIVTTTGPAILAAGIGWAVASSGAVSLLRAIAAAALAALLYVAGLGVVGRPVLREAGTIFTLATGRSGQA